MLDQRRESKQRRSVELLAAIAEEQEHVYCLAARLGSDDAALNAAPQDLGIPAGEAHKRRAAVTTDVSWPRQW